MKKYCKIISITLLLILLYIVYTDTEVENFVPYEDKRLWFYCKYQGDRRACREFRRRNAAEEELMRPVGYVSDSNNQFQLYSYPNENTGRNDFYIKVVKDNGVSYLSKVNKNSVYMGDTIESLQGIDGGPYNVTIYSKDVFYTPPNHQGHHNYPQLPMNSHHNIYNQYTGQWCKIGHLVPENPTNDDSDFYILYRKPHDRHTYDYYIVSKNGIVLPLTIKDTIYDGDTIPIPNKTDNYIFSKYKMGDPNYDYNCVY